MKKAPDPAKRKITAAKIRFISDKAS